MATKRIYDLTAHTAPADGDQLIIDRSGWAEARKIDVLVALPLRKLGSGWSLGGGGNSRGIAAVDWQQSRATDDQVAAATGSVIAGGANNLIGNSAIYAVNGGGRNNTINDRYGTIAGGYGGTVGVGADYAVVAGGRSNLADAVYAAVGGGMTNVVLSSGGAVGGGLNNTVNGLYGTVPGGRFCTASSYGLAHGYYAVGDKQGQLVQASGRFAAAGDAQHSTFVLRVVTSDATPAVVFLDGTSVPLLIADDTVWHFRAEIVAMTADAAAYAAYTVTGLVKRANGTVAVAGVTTTVINESVAGWDATAEADDTNKALSIKVTGAAGTTVRWVATVYTTECTFAG